MEVLGQAALDARRRLQIVEKRMQAPDHPVLMGMPETYYLKPHSTCHINTDLVNSRIVFDDDRSCSPYHRLTA